MSSKLIVDTIEDSTGTYSLALGSGNSTFPGGIHIGGTGSANLLDDYEEGTWTPAYATSGGGESVTYTSNTGQIGVYTKIGNLVTCHFNVDIASSTNQGSGNIRITGLPFPSGSTSSSTNYLRASFSTYNINYDGTAGHQMHFYFPTSNVSRIEVLYSRDNTSWTVGTTSNFDIGSGRAIIVCGSFSYYTDS